MTQEEKAKAYDNALERAKSLYDYNQPISAANAIINNIFPELIESEDERIRKAIIEYFENCNIKHSDWITWLEKQGEEKSVDDLTQQEAMDIAVAKCFEQGN